MKYILIKIAIYGISFLVMICAMVFIVTFFRLF